MRKVLYFLLVIIAGFISFLFLKYYNSSQKKVKQLSFCTRLPKVKIKGRQPALAPNYKLQWSNNAVLMVYFFEPNGTMDDRIIAIANTWAKYAAISFRKTNKLTKSQIRITFSSGGYASAVGLECMQSEYLDQPTMFLEGLDTLQDQNEFTRVILHEFGHAIGLEHELRKFSAIIPWDTAAVYKYYSDHYGWDTSKVNMNIFMPFNVPKEYEEFDTSSIMIYAIPDTLTMGDFLIGWPNGLSVSDTFFIKKWYPKF